MPANTDDVYMNSLWQTLLSAICITLITFPGHVYPQSAPKNLNITHYTEKEGLSRNSVTAMLQDHQGFLWFATGDGLSRFDGATFTIYDKHLSDFADFSLGTILQLAEDSLGRIWIATPSGACALDPYNNRLECIDLPELIKPMVNFIYAQNRQYIWLGTWYHVHRLDLNTLEVVSYSLKDPAYDDHYNLATCLTMLNDTILGIGGAIGLLSLNVNSGAINHDLTRTGYISRVKKMSGNRVLFTSLSKGVLIFNYETCEVENEMKGPKRVVGSSNWSGAVTGIVDNWDNNGVQNYWASGAYGVMYIDSTLGIPIVYDFKTGMPTNKIPGVFTYDVLKDRNENLWIASKEGIGRVSLQKPVFKELNLPEAIGLYSTGVNNQYWVVRKEGAVQLYDQSIDTIRESYALSFANPKLERFWCGLQDGDKGIWIGGTDALYYFNFNTRRFIPHQVNHNAAISEACYVLRYSSDGGLWMGTSKGLHRFDTVQHSFTDFTDSLEFERIDETDVMFMMIDRKDRIWLSGSMKGEFIIFDTKANRFRATKVVDYEGVTVPIVRLQNYFEDHEGQIWIPSMTGLYLYNESTGLFEENNINIPSGSLMDMISDKSGRLWTYDYKRIFAFNPVDSTVSQYTAYEGLPDAQIYTLGYIPATNEIYLNHWGANMTLFDPDALKPSEVNSLVRLTEFRLLGQDSLLKVNDSIPLRLHHRENDIRIGFRLLDFGPAQKTRYSIMLEGADDEWNNIGTSNSAIYSNLREGDYAFWVKTKTHSGNYTLPAKLAEFTIVAPFWRTNWFRMLALIILASTLVAIYRYRVNQLKKIMLVRSKISSDLHDDMGGTLTSIRVYSSMARKHVHAPKELLSIMDRIEDTAGEMIQSMSDIVWMINPKYDAFSYVLQRMENFAANLLAAKEIEYTLKKDPDIEAIKLSMEKRKNLFLIFKEAVNNAAKHSQCKRMDICITHTDHRLKVSITDDGIGFNVTPTQNGGNGLVNMRQRASEMGGSLEIVSDSAHGTGITLSLPV